MTTLVPISGSLGMALTGSMALTASNVLGTRSSNPPPELVNNYYGNKKN
jgi:hypothetical protein